MSARAFCESTRVWPTQRFGLLQVGAENTLRIQASGSDSELKHGGGVAMLRLIGKSCSVQPVLISLPHCGSCHASIQLRTCVELGSSIPIGAGALSVDHWSCLTPLQFPTVKMLSAKVFSSEGRRNSGGGYLTKKGTNRSLHKCLASGQVPRQSPQQPEVATERSIWPFGLLPRPLIYSSNFSDVDPVQLSELWSKTLKVERDPNKILKALRHSFAFVVVLAEDEETLLSTGSRLRTVEILVRQVKTLQSFWRISLTDRVRRWTGAQQFRVGRAISDGTFIASICDVAVDPAYRHRGIGRRIVKKLVENMKKTGGPSGYAAFPPPVARRFFWMIGFRGDKKYRLMAYRGNGEELPQSSETTGELAPTKVE